MTSGNIVQITRSISKGVTEDLYKPVRLIKDFGIQNDFHGKKGSRQLSLMTKSVAGSLGEVREQGLCTKRFIANILISDVDKRDLQVGAIICFEQAEIEITESGKQCFGCALSETGQYCPLVDDVIFAEVKKEGLIKQGDYFEIKI
ncbi:hypothetical protein Q5O24_10805 [Eubacteriaceae bacterium ES3]|nr:hypothetical protein Q5O24_10805 [Eubacteriaceae bacterium ES3]